MTSDRLNAFSDGVIAIIITIMVLELKVPHEADWSALASLAPVFLSYILSFINIAIYWNNHHHLMQTCERVDAGILWANMHLLFWQSLVPFTTAWMGENHFESLPTALYGFTLLMQAGAYTVLQAAIVRGNGEDGILARAIGEDFKGKISLVMYAAGIGLAFYAPWLACALYVAVAAMWLIPDRRIEQKLEEQNPPSGAADQDANRKNDQAADHDLEGAGT
jgi:uncharacterized membrane protein